MNGNPTNGGGDASTTNTQINQQIPVGQQQQEMVKNEPQQYDMTAMAQQQPQLAYTPITNANMQRPDSGCFLRCRGLPFAASENDVRSFFGGFNKNNKKLHSIINYKNLMLWM